MKQLARLGACLSAALLAACGNGSLTSTPMSVEPQNGMQAHSSQPAAGRFGSHGVKRASETLAYLHDFGSSGDGTSPIGPLLDVGGTLYGVTNAGGAQGVGTVYSVSPSGSPSGTYSLLYSFNHSGDGANPSDGLVNLNGTLYGTEYNGGVYNVGTVYSVTTSGTESVLYTFYPGSDGANPAAGLTYSGGKFYGTTAKGGRIQPGNSLLDNALRRGDRPLQL